MHNLVNDTSPPARHRWPPPAEGEPGNRSWGGEKHSQPRQVRRSTKARNGSTARHIAISPWPLILAPSTALTRSPLTTAPLTAAPATAAPVTRTQTAHADGAARSGDGALPDTHPGTTCVGMGADVLFMLCVGADAIPEVMGG